MCCTVAGILAVFVLLSMSSRPHAHRMQDYKGRMVPVFVSSMKSAFNAISAISAKQADAEADVDVDEKKMDVFSKTEDDEVLSNITPCAAGETCTEQEVTENLKKKYDDKVKKYMTDHPNHVMFIFAPWCGHCKTAMPEFCEARKKTKTPLAIVNSNMVSRELLKTHFGEMGVTHFPFIIKKTTNATEVFKGKAMCDNIAEFAKKDDLQMMFM